MTTSVKNNSVANLETALMKLIFKTKKLQYDIARLEYRIWLAVTKLENVNILISEEEEIITSYNSAIAVVKEGKVKDQLNVLKTKSVFKLFKLNLRKNKINIVKLVLNQSKCGQLKEALTSVENDIEAIKSKLENIKNSEIKVEQFEDLTISIKGVNDTEILNNSDFFNLKSFDQPMQKLKVAS